MLLRREGRHLDAAARREVCDAIVANPALGSAAARAAPALCDAGWLQTWPDGALVVAQGAPCDDVQVVLSGTVEMGVARADGSRVVISYIQPQEIIGIIGAIDGRGSLHDHRAHGTTTLFHIPREALLAQLTADPALLFGTFALICARARLLYDGIEKMVLSTLRARLAGRLQWLAATHGRETPEGTELTIRLSQEDLASMLATSRQSVNKELRRLAAEEVIDIRYSRVVVRDMERLRRISVKEG
ncbi:Crp/Fnr family transcriptional regulator [Xylophilus sp.]|uniref:Crp/Fnr family transcriptional regulator n=1 Tax=Xylophilus sp. TaxID=2653893 RepID=UPI0013BC1617|nr:Crp/Fnr family transcriptional regulator [Xylophilus sp.]KAF1046984.1 MAG: CRP-like cAMP-activated global transcriptional regulator [Xylophilus sp.]